MRIDTNSWHYKMNYRNYGDSIPKSLCPYFWSTVLSIVLISWLGALINLIERQHWRLPEINIGIFNFLGKHRIAIFSIWNGGLFTFGAIGYFIFGNASGLINMGVGAGLLVFMKFSDSIFKATTRVTYKIPDNNKQPSIFKEFVKAKHKSVCPMLEFVDVKQEEFNKQVKKIDEKPPFKFMESLDQKERRPNQVESETYES